MKYSIYLMAFTFITGCSPEKEIEEELEFSTISQITIWDIANNDNASDIRVDFKISGTVGIEEFWVFITKESNSSLLVEEILALDNDQFETVSVSGASYNIQLSENLKDTDGDEIILNRLYKIQIFIVGSEIISDFSEEFRITNEPVLNGSYTGLWNDNFYTNFGISATIRGNGNSYTGEFYYTEFFNPCCGGVDDGNISMIIENGQITDFFYDQDLLNYMGGCPGAYTGSGNVKDDITLKINFEGLDCDGTHVGGIIELTKIP